MDLMEGKIVKSICLDCIEEDFLSKEIALNGKLLKCSYCKIRKKTYTLDMIKDRVHEVIQLYYEQTSSEPNEYESRMQWDSDSKYEWERDGAEIVEVIEELLGVEEKISKDILKSLQEEHVNYSDEVEGPYDDSTMYKEKKRTGEEFNLKWQIFEENLKLKSRYFGHQVFLDELFSGLHKFVTTDSKPVITIIGPKMKPAPIFRARVAKNYRDLTEILKFPEKELGPPPSSTIKGGRMNAPGIAVFYGAFSQECAISEVRPHKGAKVIVGKFEAIKNLRLLDIPSLRSIELNGSLFDPEHRISLEVSNFLSELSHRISRLVTPEEENWDYLATQIIADYLAWNKDLSIQGLIYESAYHSGGSNVVIFNSFATIDLSEAVDPKRVDVWMPYNPEDDEDSINISIEYQETEVHKDNFNFNDADSEFRNGLKKSGSYLSLDKNDIQVVEVEKIKIEQKSISVQTYRQKNLHFRLAQLSITMS